MGAQSTEVIHGGAATTRLLYLERVLCTCHAVMCGGRQTEQDACACQGLALQYRPEGRDPPARVGRTVPSATRSSGHSEAPCPPSSDPTGHGPSEPFSVVVLPSLSGAAISLCRSGAARPGGAAVNLPAVFLQGYKQLSDVKAFLHR